MVDFFEIKMSKDVMKHASGTYLWILGRNLLPHMYSLLKKYLKKFLLKIKRLFELPFLDQHFKRRNNPGRTFQIE